MIDWSKVKAVTIPEGDVQEISIDGVLKWKKINNLLPLPQGSGNYPEAPDVIYNNSNDNFMFKGVCPTSFGWAIFRLSFKNDIALSLTEVVNKSDGEVFLKAGVEYSIQKNISSSKDYNFIIVYSDGSRQVYDKLNSLEVFAKDVKDIWIRNLLKPDKNVDIEGSLIILPNKV